MLFSLFVLNLLGAISCKYSQELYFDYAPAHKNIYHDMTNTTASIEDEIERSSMLHQCWNWTLANHPELHTNRERILVSFIAAFSGQYNAALRQWFNSTDNRFEYYWSTKLLMNSVIDVTDRNITCYRGEPPHQPLGSKQWVKRGNYSHGDLLYTNTFDFCSLNKDWASNFAMHLATEGGPHAVLGNVYTLYPKYVLNSTQIDPKYKDELELIIPPGYQYLVTKADKTDSLDQFDEYSVVEL